MGDYPQTAPLFWGVSTPNPPLPGGSIPKDPGKGPPFGGSWGGFWGVSPKMTPLPGGFWGVSPQTDPYFGVRNPTFGVPGGGIPPGRGGFGGPGGGFWGPTPQNDPEPGVPVSGTPKRSGNGVEMTPPGGSLFRPFFDPRKGSEKGVRNDPHFGAHLGVHFGVGKGVEKSGQMGPVYSFIPGTTFVTPRGVQIWPLFLGVRAFKTRWFWPKT